MHAHVYRHPPPHTHLLKEDCVGIPSAACSRPVAICVCKRSEQDRDQRAGFRIRDSAHLTIPTGRVKTHAHSKQGKCICLIRICTNDGKHTSIAHSYHQCLRPRPHPQADRQSHTFFQGHQLSVLSLVCAVRLARLKAGLLKRKALQCGRQRVGCHQCFSFDFCAFIEWYGFCSTVLFARTATCSTLSAKTTHACVQTVIDTIWGKHWPGLRTKDFPKDEARLPSSTGKLKALSHAERKGYRFMHSNRKWLKASPTKDFPKYEARLLSFFFQAEDGIRDVR